MGSGLRRLRAASEHCDGKDRLCAAKGGKTKRNQQLSDAKALLISIKLLLREAEKAEQTQKQRQNGILWFICVAQHLNIPRCLHSDKLNPLNPG